MQIFLTKTLKDRQRLRLQLLSLVAGVGFILWGFFHPYYEPHAFDPIWLRVSLGLGLVLVSGYGFLQRKDSSYFFEVVHWGGWVLNLHFCYLYSQDPSTIIPTLGWMIVMPTLLLFIPNQKRLIRLVIATFVLAFCLPFLHEGSFNSRDALSIFAILTVVIPNLIGQLERLDLQADLKMQTASQAKLMLNMNEGLILQDESGQVVQINPSAQRILGLAEATFTKGSLSKLPKEFLFSSTISEDPSEENHPAQVALRENRVVKGYRAIIQNDQGKRTYLYASSVPLEENGGQSRRVLTTFTDMTKLVESEEQLLEQQNQIALQSKLSALGDMAGGIAHEINNPLAIVSARVEQIQLLIHKPDIAVEKIDAAAEKCLAAIGRVQKIIQGLRSVARDSSHDVFENIILENSVQEILAISHEKMLDAEIAVHVNIPHDLAIYAQSGQVAQVLLNLVNNAIDEVKTCEVRSISISAKPSEEFIELRVTDSGRGIPPDLRDKIMNPFFTTKEVGSGTGLGLSIAARIMKNHNGELLLDENEKQTSFVMKFPKARPVQIPKSA